VHNGEDVRGEHIHELLVVGARALHRPDGPACRTPQPHVSGKQVASDACCDHRPSACQMRQDRARARASYQAGGAALQGRTCRGSC